VKLEKSKFRKGSSGETRGGLYLAKAEVLNGKVRYVGKWERGVEKGAKGG